MENEKYTIPEGFEEGIGINFADGERKFIDLEFEDGESGEYMVVDIIEADGRDYIVLTPEADFDNDDETLLLYYRYDEDENGEPILGQIESDEEFDKVLDAFEAVMDEIEYDQMADEMDGE